jgi:hypothetical protein
MGFLEFTVRLLAALLWLLVKWVFRKLGALCAKAFRQLRPEKPPVRQPQPQLVWSQRFPEGRPSKSTNANLKLVYSKPEEPKVALAPPPAAVPAPVVATRHPPAVGHAPFLSLGAAPSNRTPRKPTRPPSIVALASYNREVTGPRNTDRSHLTLVVNK